MAYKVGTTIVIDDSGNVDWSRIANKPAIGTGDVTAVTVTNSGIGSGVNLKGTLNVSGGSACTANCYVASLSGGGSSGNISITANRSYFNCNCNCRC
jgi:hypothetical protein